MPTKSSTNSSGKSDDKVLYIIAYLIPILTGILVYIINGNKNKRMKLHAVQSLFLGIVFVVVDIALGFLFFVPFLGIITSLILLLIWLYGLYAGFQAYNGVDIEIPLITDYAKRYSK